MEGTIRGNKVLTGTWGELWFNGLKLMEVSKVESKITVNREDVQLGLDVDSKITGVKGEGTITVKKVFTRSWEIAKDYLKGIDTRYQLVTKLKDPDAVNGQIERYAINNVWFTELPLANYEKGALIEEELPIGFPPSDVQNLDQISA